MRRTKQKHQIFGSALLSIFTFFFLAAATVRGQIVVTAPAVKDNIKAAPDYATEVLQDRLDMNERTDLGWRIFNTVEKPVSCLSNISFSGGLFTAQTLASPNNATESDANIFIIDSNYKGSSGVGKFGSNYKIDADKYTVFAVRMFVPSPVHTWPTGQLFWSEDTIYSGQSWSNTFMIYGGWAIYLIDLPTLGLLGGNTSKPVAWTGLKDSLRFDPTTQIDKTIQIDWIRLVQNGSDFRRTITWTGEGEVDLYLDNDTNSGNGNLGLLAPKVSGGSYTFVAGGLAAGNYYVAIAPAGTSAYSYSAGYYEVTEQPILRIDKPSEEGSAQDFITVTTGNPWDFDALSDVDHTVNVHDQSIQTITYEDLAGKTYTGNTVFYGVSDATSGIGDPSVFFLNPWVRGKTYKIDTSRYHNLVAKMGIAGVHSTNDGSIARVMYMREDEHAVGENVSQDIIIRHLPLSGGKWVMHKITADLRTLALESGAGSPSRSGWTGTVDSFRMDPHEFSAARAFFFDDVKITADWRADTSFTIDWTLEDADTPTGATVALYYDVDRSGYDGTLIEAGISAASGSGSYTWDTSNIPGGTYSIYIVVSDGTNQNKSYAGGPLIVDHVGFPVIGLSKQTLNFAAERYGTPTPAENVTVTNTGTGTLNWTATPSANWISVSPASGTGSGTLTIGIARTDLSTGSFSGTVTISDPNASNSSQVITVTCRIYSVGSDLPPFGNFSTPTDGSTVASSVPVTGWVLDDIGMKSVKIYRGTGLSDRIYIGDAQLVRGARPDVEKTYPLNPQNYQAGWGYMLLTNFLPNGGNGTFTLLAFANDVGGHEVLLGSKTIICNNQSATKPFGAIDTPAQGGTASGSGAVNFGWVLTPQPNSIPTDGSTIWVYVDGVPLGHPVYNNYRADIATMFPGYANSSGAVGYYYLDTTKYSNGVHTIVWGVSDSAGNGDGIGSRYFTIQNISGASAAKGIAADGIASAGVFLSPEDRPAPVFVKQGGLDAPVTAVYPDMDGPIRLTIPEVTRVAVYLNEAAAGEDEAEPVERGRRAVNMKAPVSSGNRYEAYELACGELRPLPVGASFNPRDGVFYWQPGPGFLGEFTIVFIRKEGAGSVRKTVNITIGPKTEPFR